MAAVATVGGPMATLPLDAHVIDALLPDLVGHDRQPSAFLVWLSLWRRSLGAGRPSVQISLLDVAAATGLSKRAVQDAIGRLARRKLLSIERASMTAVPI